MPSPFSYSEISTINLTGDSSVDALIHGSRWKDNTISYSFPDEDALWLANPFSGYSFSGEPWSTSYTPITVSNQSDFENALQQWEAVADINFNFINESSSDVGDIRIAYTEVPAFRNAEAWAYFPTPGVWSGDIWISKSSLSATREWSAGSYSNLTVLHEIGHALGLGHPFEVASFPTKDDTMSATIMSYSALPGNTYSFFDYYPTTPMPLDIKAIQHIYGANTNYHNGNDTWHYTDATPYHETLWDGGGIDTIDYTGDRAASIQLEAGSGSFIGQTVHAYSDTENIAVPNVWIAYDTHIENANGGSSHDELYGNPLDNILSGNAGNDSFVGFQGNDTFLGGTGIDQALFEGNRNEYTLSQSETRFSIEHHGGNNGNDILDSIERLYFDDIGLALDLDGHAGQVAKLLGAVFGADTVHNHNLMRIGLSLADQQLSDEQLALSALNAADAHDPDTLITLLWRNLSGQEPTPDEKQPYLELLDSNQMTITQLTGIAADSSFNTDNINLIGLIQTGIEFGL